MKNEILENRRVIESKYDVEELINSLHEYDDESDDNDSCYFAFSYVDEIVIERVDEKIYQRANLHGDVNDKWDISVEERKEDLISYLLRYKDEINEVIKAVNSF